MLDPRISVLGCFNQKLTKKVQKTNFIKKSDLDVISQNTFLPWCLSILKHQDLRKSILKLLVTLVFQSLRRVDFGI